MVMIKSEYKKEGYLIIEDSLKAYSSRSHGDNTAWISYENSLFYDDVICGITCL
jgi:hypothetical protein